MTVRAEIGFEKDRRIVRVKVDDTTVIVNLDAETGVVENVYGGYGIEVSGPWHKFREKDAEITQMRDAPPKFHYEMPETQAVRLLQVDVQELKAKLTVAREVLRGLHGKGARLNRIEDAERILDAIAEKEDKG